MNQVLLSLLGPYKRLNLSFAAKVQKIKGREQHTQKKETEKSNSINNPPPPPNPSINQNQLQELRLSEAEAEALVVDLILDKRIQGQINQASKRGAGSTGCLSLVIQTK
jgi:hypothetical protein